MKLNENQVILVREILVQCNVDRLIVSWQQKEHRNLVLDELLRLCSKLKVTVRNDQVKHWRDLAGKGK